MATRSVYFSDDDMDDDEEVKVVDVPDPSTHVFHHHVSFDDKKLVTSDYTAYGKYNSIHSQGNWIFNSTEVVISDKVVGRGAFGEVRVATWRNMEVACKKLHSSFADEDEKSDSNTSPRDSSRLQSEIEMLSKLRHPNLVQFLGACLDDNGVPNVILTELMQYSLYDILEDKKVKLNLADVIDISQDISIGINYLHSHDPPIVHRDISSKNILMDGRRAKISDLGQAKMFDASVLSRQSGMPGAMAYTAPEVLTGKYSEKIDIFSFGVLMIQMCTGSYPRIDRREEHVKAASEGEFAALSPLLKSMINYQPNERPRADTVCQIIKDIRFNDRFFPLQRRQLPQSEISVLGFQWINSEHERKSEELKLLLTSATERLKKEENRWQKEANRADVAEKSVRDNDIQIADLQGVISAKVVEIDELKEKNKNLRSDNIIANQSIKMKDSEIVRLSSLLRDLEGKYAAQSEDLKYSKGECELLAHKIHDLQIEIEYKSVQHHEAVEKEAESHQVLELVNEDLQEVETRLEQALTRWKIERDNLLEEKKKYSTLHHKYLDVMDKMKILKHDHDVLQECFNEYIELPPAATLKTIMKDYKLRQVSDAEAIQQLTTSCSLKDKEIRNGQDNLEKSFSSLKAVEADLKDMTAQLELKTKELIDLEASNMTLKGTIQNLEGTNSLLDRERSNLSENISSLKAKFDLFSDNLSQVFDRWKVRESLDTIKTESILILTLPLEKLLDYIIRSKIALKFGGKEGEIGFCLPAEPSVAENKEQEKKPTKEGESEDSFSIAGFEAKKESSFLKLAQNVKKTAQKTASMAAQLEATKDDNEEAERMKKKDAAAKETVAKAIAEGHHSLLTLLSEGLDDSCIVWRSVRGLRDLIVSSEAVKYDCIGLHLDEILLKAMRLHEKDVMVQSQCSRLLGNIAFGQDFVRKRVGSNDGIHIIVSALDEFGETEEHLAINSCSAITNLIHNNLENRQRLVECGGVECISLLMMVSYISSVKFQRQGCYLLLTLAGSDESCREISNRGGIQIVINTMTQYRFDRDVQLYGAWCICNLALAGEDIKRKLKKAGAVDVCKVILEIHKEDEEVLKHARNALGTLGPIITNKIPGEREKDKKK